MKQKSEIDELFFRLMGYYPNKSGEAYEIISVATLGIVKQLEAEHNMFLQGDSAGRPYQIDGLLNGKIMVESKDYTIECKKVGRPDMQKMQGALTDLPEIKEGFFTSATDYSRDAIKYTQGTETNERHKEITTFDIRPSTQEDKKGRVLSINVTIKWAMPNFERGRTSFLFAEGGVDMINDYMQQHGISECQLTATDLFDKDEHVLTTIADLSHNNQPMYDDDTEVVSGVILIDAYLKFYDIFVPIVGISYADVPIVRGTENFVIKAQGDATILIKSGKAGINKLITDVDLKKAIQNIIDKKSK